MTLPTITLAVLARDMAYCLPEYLACIDALDYPKGHITVRIRTNDNSDGTEEILRAWVEKVNLDYHHVELDASPLGSGDAGHTWSDANLSRIIRVREESLMRFKVAPTDYYFACDCDNFLTEPSTLSDLVALRMPIVAPMLEPLPHEESFYRNYFAAIDVNGYYAESPFYVPVLLRLVRGAVILPVVHCTYLIEASAIVEGRVTYVGPAAYDFVNLSSSARASRVDQWLLNEKFYGYLLHGVEGDESKTYAEACRPKILERMGQP
jgi:hypothetical protein